jgi:hypothetical protein
VFVYDITSIVAVMPNQLCRKDEGALDRAPANSTRRQSELYGLLRADLDLAAHWRG